MEEVEQLYDREMIYHEKDMLGGRPGTICVLWSGNDRFVGWSRCHSLDQFNRKIGRKISRGRALQALKEKYGYSNVRRESSPKDCYRTLDDDPMIQIYSRRTPDEKVVLTVVEYEVPEFLYRQVKKKDKVGD